MGEGSGRAELGDADVATRLAQTYCDETGSVAPPIFQSSLFTFETYADFEDTLAGRTDLPLYTRVNNPTVQAFEALMAEAENGQAAVGFASGMAAISSTVLAFLKPGDRLVCVEHVYPDAYRLFERLLRPFGVDVSYHSLRDFEDDPDLMKGARLAYLESPNSVMMQTMNLPLVAGHARRHGTLTIVDNSWATPIFQRPLDSGIDIVLHSASKYISGHSDTVAGIVVSRRDLINRIRDFSLPLLGAKLAPFEAWLLVRGLRTLDARMRAHQASANTLIDRLSASDAVTRIHSPGPNTTPGLMGRSGLMSVELSERVDIPALADALTLYRMGVSWGGFESLILPARVALGQAGEHNSMQRFGVPNTLIRLSIGLENVEDLWADLSSALRKCTA